MEGIIAHRVTPLLKCVVLFLFIFTAKVLTTKPQESGENRNGIQPLKTSHYVRTFTKYHHRRTNQWNNPELWTDDHPRVIQKRNAIPDTNFIEQENKELWNDDHPRVIQKRNAIPDTNFIGQENKNGFSNEYAVEKDAININKGDKGTKTHDKNSLSNESKKYKIKPAFIPTDTPKIVTSTISCLYQTRNVAMSATPSYEEDENAQFMIENDNYGRHNFTII